MRLRVGVVSAAHVHAPSFVHSFSVHPMADLVGVWDEDTARGREFAAQRGLKFFDEADALLGRCDAVVICSENMNHAAHIEMAASRSLAILCEKPIAPRRDHVERIREAVAKWGSPFMTAFPCPFSPTFQRMKRHLEGGEVGRVLALSTTNRGQCPFGWFVEPEKSGGGAMIDHVVHVADLLRRLLGEDPETVFAQTSNGMYSQDWDDTAKLTISFPSGVFATLDSSWSRPASYKIWGDVTLRAVGERGVLEADLFGQGVDLFSNATSRHTLEGTGSGLDSLMVGEFVDAVLAKRQPMVTLQDGLMASRTALAAYESTKSGVPERV